MPHPEYSTHHNLEISREGNFIVIEWSNSDLDLNQVISQEIKDTDWRTRRNVEKEKFIKAFIGEENGVFTLWISIAKQTEHNLLYFNLPDEERKKIKVAGIINKGENNFTISAYSLYEKVVLDKHNAIDWLGNNLPSWT